MNSDKIDRKNSIGVAFSGGGLQGIAHIGAVQALYELGIHPQYVSGTSSGAAMAAIVAMGCDSDEMKRVAKWIPLCRGISTPPIMYLPSSLNGTSNGRYSMERVKMPLPTLSLGTRLLMVLLSAMDTPAWKALEMSWSTLVRSEYLRNRFVRIIPSWSKYPKEE